LGQVAPRCCTSRRAEAPITIRCPSPQNNLWALTIPNECNRPGLRPTPPLNLVPRFTLPVPITITCGEESCLPPGAQKKRSLDDATVVQTPKCPDSIRKLIDRQRPCARWIFRQPLRGSFQLTATLASCALVNVLFCSFLSTYYSWWCKMSCLLEPQAAVFLPCALMSI
jgi:hypothetical protein